MRNKTNIGCYILSLAISGLSLSVAANEAVNLNVAIQKCAKLSNDQEKLACFDKLAKPETEVLAIDIVTKETQPSTLQNKKQLVESEDISDFGQEHLDKTAEQKAQEVNHIELEVSQLTKLIRGEWKITFKNGQVWQQKNTTRFNLHIEDRVIIEKGALSSFYLKKADSNRRIPVKRLK